MSQENDSESEFYYQKESDYGEDNVGENNQNNAENNSQEQIDTFINEQKSANTTKKTRRAK